jgi:hypothetical protein
MSVTLIFLAKINGISSTPTFSDFAVTNGNFPNAGSSAIDSMTMSAPQTRVNLAVPANQKAREKKEPIC